MNLQALYSLFVARSDVYAVQQPDGSYRTVRGALTLGELARHVRGEVTLGVYQISPAGTVKWACLDFDRDPEQGAKKVFKYLSRPESPYRNALLLEYTGGRGFHLWVFFKGDPPAAAVRAIFTEIVGKLGVECEVFPKQDDLAEGGLGSLVKLPFGVHRRTGRWSYAVSPASVEDIEPVELPPSLLVRAVLTHRSRDGAGRFSPPPAGLWSRCAALKRINGGVEEGARNEAAFLKARIYYWMGLSREEAWTLIKAWNEKNRPPLPEGELKSILRSAYTRGYLVGLRSIARNAVLSRFCDGCESRVCHRFIARSLGALPDATRVRL